MALQVWLPLTGDLTQQGLSDVEVTNNGAVVSNDGKLGKCYQFFNNAIYGDFSGINLMEQMSGSCWVYLTSLSGAQYFFHFGGQGSYPCKFSLDYEGSIRSIINGTEYVSGITLAINTWYHLAVTFDGNIVKWYVNGEEKAFKTVTGTFSASNHFAIGSRTNSSAGTAFAYPLNKGRMNDIRIYDHCLSVKEVKELSKGLVLHYKLDDPYIESSITNLAKNVTYAVYNNHSVGGVTGSLTKLNETYQGCDIYRLTMIPNETYVSTFKTSLYNHGVYGFRNTFKASTKYCFWIYYRPVTHQDIRVGGTASNINGWTEIPSQKYSDEWYVVGQYRNGSVTEAKTDSIFTSICTPTAEAGVPISVDFCCPHLIEGYSEIKDTGNYQDNIETGIIFDESGYGYNGGQLGTLEVSNDTARYNNSINFNGTDDGILTENLPLSNVINSEITYSFWIKPNGESGARSVYFGSYSGTSWSIEKSTGNLLRLYWNGSPDESCTGATITDGIWQHVCITKKGTNDVKVYINGQQKWTSTAAHNVLTFPTTYRIGRDVRSGDGTPYKGLMSDFRIYATALSAEDVAELYHTAASIDKQGNLFCGEVVE